MYKFSVIIPVYNSAEYIKDSIFNLLKQTFDNFEIIIINDGSTDNTSQILSQFINNERIKIVEYKKNVGVSHARNIGISNSSGEFLLFLDSDDFLEYSCLKNLNNILSLNACDIVSFGFIKSFNEKKTCYSSPRFNNQLFTNKDFLKKYLSRTIYQCMCSFVCSREIIIENKILFSENVFFAEDQEFQIKCMYFSKKIFYTAVPYFKYNLQENSVMNSNFSEKRLTILDAFSNLFTIKNSDRNLEKLLVNYFFYNYYSLVKFALKSNYDLSLLNDYYNSYSSLKYLKPFFILNKISLQVNILHTLNNHFPYIFKNFLQKTS